MPPKTTTKKQSSKCLKIGEILIDENKKLLYLCVQCFLDFEELHDLQEHLKTCDSVSHIFKAQSSSKINFDSDSGTKLLTQVIKDAKELHIYGIDNTTKEEENGKENGDISDFLDIEEELLNPRWFTVTTPKDEIETNCEKDNRQETSYSDLILEVTPFVQFKENVKANVSSSDRVTRESSKQNAAKEKEEKSNTVSMENKKKSEPLTSHGKLYLSDDKKHILRATLEQTSASGSKESINRQTKIEKNTNTITKKPLLKSIAKSIKEKTILSATEKEKMVSSIIQEKLPYKRKVTSLANKSQDEVECHSMMKRRKTIPQQLDGISTKTITSHGIKPEQTKPIQTSLAKTAQDDLSVLLKHQKAILESNKKENNKIVSTKEPIKSKEQNTLPNNRQSMPQIQTQSRGKQQHSQVKMNTNLNRLQPTITSVTNRISNQPLLLNKNIKVETKESQQTTAKFVQHISKATSTPIPKKILNYQTTTTTTTTAATTTAATTTAIQKPTESSNQKTVEILNKLQTLGLKIQRTNPMPEQSQKRPPAANEQALEIIKKLQSKGMNVKIVPKQSTTAVPMKASTMDAFTVVHSPSQSLVESEGNMANHLPAFSSIKCKTTDTVLSSKPIISKNILIKKCT